MQNNNCKNNSHCRKLLSATPTSFSNTQEGDPRQKHSGMTIKKQVILNLIQDLQRLPLSFLNNLRGRCQIKFGMTFLFSNSGFTLIELLVVVLIIGILAAVAVPQYNMAVIKSQYMQLLISADAIYKAEKVYYLANDSYTNDLSELDISTQNNDNHTCYVLKQYHEIYCFLKGNNNGLGYHIYIDSGNKACLALQNKDKTTLWEKICTNMTGKNTGGTNAEYRWFGI